MPGIRRARALTNTTMILIVSFPNNEHVEQVRKHLTVESIVVDTASFPRSLGLSAAIGRERECLKFTLPGGEELCLCNVGAVWYRRIKPYQFHAELEDHTAKLFAWSEANEALLGYGTAWAVSG